MRICLIAFGILLAGSMMGQHLALNLQAELEKEFKFSKKWSLLLEQQFRVSPQLEKIKSDEYFNDFGLTPLSEYFKQLDDDAAKGKTDDKSSKGNANSSSGEEEDLLTNGSTSGPQSPGMPDEAQTIDWSWRSATDLTFRYRINKNFRLGAEYDFQVRPKSLQHVIQPQLIFSHKIGKSWSMMHSLKYQFAVTHGEQEWEQGANFSSQINYKIGKNHAIRVLTGVNGGLDQGIFEWDRVRIQPSLRYKVTDNQVFQFSYSYQRRLTRIRESHGVGFSYSLEF